MGIKPDVCVYHALDTEVTGTDSSLVKIIIEFKWLLSNNPFMWSNDKDNAQQIMDYVATHLSSQSRTHIYSVLLRKQTTTILRWDRAGVIIIKSIQYNASPHLVEFFHRYSCALPAMHGMDQSVSEPTLAEAVVARQVLELDKKVQLFKLKIPRAGHASNYFITCTSTV